MDEAAKLVQRTKALSQRVQQILNREVAEHDEIGAQVKQIQATVKEGKAAARGDRDLLEVYKEVESILNGMGPGGDLKRFLTSTQPRLLNLLIGKTTCVVAWSTSRSVAIKEEYHKFKTKSAYTMGLFSFLLLLGFRQAEKRQEANEDITLTPPLLVFLQLFLIWLLYFYTSMALRENVLKVNGSHIRPWWVQHHYFSMATLFLFLGIPIDSPVMAKYIKRHLFWTALQSVTMVLQNRYQRRRMYTRIALGKNNAMDVLGGEASGVSGQLLLLVPLLFAMQGLQILLGLDMVSGTYHAFTSLEGFLNLESHDSDLWGSRGMFVAGLLTMYMGLQNTYNTIITINEKHKVKHKIRALQAAKSNVGSNASGLNNLVTPLKSE